MFALLLGFRTPAPVKSRQQEELKMKRPELTGAAPAEILWVRARANPTTPIIYIVSTNRKERGRKGNKNIYLFNFLQLYINIERERERGRHKCDDKGRNTKGKKALDGTISEGKIERHLENVWCVYVFLE